MALKPKTRLQTPIWIAKLALVSLLLLSTAIVTVKLAIPFAHHALISTLPSIRTALRTYLAPPYLFVTINFIILVIWKLSEKNEMSHPSDRPEPTSHIAPLNPKPLKQQTPTCPTAPALQVEKHDPTRQPTPTFQKDHGPTQQTAPATHSSESPTAPAVPEDETLSMDATWRKIAPGMKRSGTFQERRRADDPAPEVRKLETFREWQGVAEGRAELLLMGHDELNRRSEAFIKMVNEQIQQQQNHFQPAVL